MPDLRRFPAARLAFVLAAGLLASSARADLPLGPLVYFEDFDDEISLPTTPEVDALGFGAMAGFRDGNPLPLFPTITGGELLIAVQEASPYTLVRRASGAQVPVATEPEERIGIAARFDGFETVKDPTNGAFQTAAVTLRDSTLDNGASAYLLEFGPGALRVAVSNLGPVFLSGYDDVFLTETAEDAIRGGAPFAVALLFDRAARTAQASLSVGEETFTTEATTSSTFDSMDVIDTAQVVNTTNNNAPPLATIASDLLDLAIHVPEPGAGPAMLAACAALAACASQRRTT